MSHQDREKNKRLHETIASLSSLPQSPTERDEQLHELAEDIVSSYGRAKDPATNDPKQWDIHVAGIERLIKPLFAQVRLDTLAEAARAICSHCKAGLAVEYTDSFDKAAMHRMGIGYVFCAAQEVAALRRAAGGKT